MQLPLSRTDTRRLLLAAGLVWVGCAQSGATLGDNSGGFGSDDDSSSVGDSGVVKQQDAGPGLEPDPIGVGSDAGRGSDAGSAPADAGQPLPDAASGPDAATNQCPQGSDDCAGLCIDLKSSAANCGACDHACPGNQACDGTGSCRAPAGCSYVAQGTQEYFFCSDAKSWGDARSACLGWGMDLSVIEDQAENELVRLRGDQWIGLNDQGNEGSWLWIPRGNAGSVNGSAAPFTSWTSGEPNNTRSCTLGFCSGPGEDCVEIHADGGWNDGKCDNSRAFVCETY